MPFKSDKQRRAFFAMKGIRSRGSTSPRIIRDNKNATRKELEKKGIFLMPNKDTDRDGVINSKDCKPFDPKKQGRLHDLAIAALRKKEEFVERRREKRMAKLEDLKDKLRARKDLLSSRNAILAEKQGIIDEVKREKDSIRALKTANKEAKRELFRTSKLGAAARIAGKAGKATGRFLTSERTKKAIRGSTLALGQAAGFLSKKQVKGIKKRFKTTGTKASLKKRQKFIDENLPILAGN